MLTGPGDVWLQSLPFSRLAGRMMAGARGGKEEGSVLGGNLFYKEITGFVTRRNVPQPFRKAGIDLVTMGDHIYKKQELLSILEREAELPAMAGDAQRLSGAAATPRPPAPPIARCSTRVLRRKTHRDSSPRVSPVPVLWGV